MEVVEVMEVVEEVLAGVAKEEEEIAAALTEEQKQLEAAMKLAAEEQATRELQAAVLREALLDRAKKLQRKARKAQGDGGAAPPDPLSVSRGYGDIHEPVRGLATVTQDARFTHRMRGLATVTWDGSGVARSFLQEASWHREAGGGSSC